MECFQKTHFQVQTVHNLKAAQSPTGGNVECGIIHNLEAAPNLTFLTDRNVECGMIHNLEATTSIATRHQ